MKRRFAPIAASTTYLEEPNVKVTMTTLLAGPQGVAKPGTVLDLPEPKAKEMVESHFARPYDGERDKKAPQGLQQAPQTWER